MNSGTHMIVGALTGGLALVYAVSQQSFSFQFTDYHIYPVAITFAAVIGGIAPDVDMARSISGRFVRNMLRLFLAASVLLLAVIFLNPNVHLPFIGDALQMGARIDRSYPIITAVTCIVLFIVIEKSKHRGFTHTLAIPLIILFSIVYAVETKSHFAGDNVVVSLEIGFLLGWLSHLVADTFNYPGVPWLWPLTDNHLNILRVDTGTSEETVFRVAAILFYTVVYAGAFAFLMR